MRTLSKKLAPIAVRAALAAATALAALPARAEGDPAAEAAAVALFNDAQKLVAAGDYASACPKFLEVKKTLPTAGLSLNLGDCLEHEGKLASAWAEFEAAGRKAQITHDADREAEAQRRAQAIEGKLSKLTINVGQRERLPGLVVRRDGADIGESQYGTAVPVDPGSHTIEVSAPGFRTWSTTVDVVPIAGAASVAVPHLVPEPHESKGDGQPAGAAPDGARPFWSGQRIGGAAVIGVGVVGLGLGAVFGKVALSKDSPAVGPSPNSSALGFAHASTASFVVGGAAVVGGIILMATTRSAKTGPTSARLEAAPWIAPSTGGDRAARGLLIAR